MESLEDAARLLSVQQGKVRDDDAVQEGFVRLASRGPETIGNAGGYWYTAARRSLIERQRKAATERRAIVGYLDGQAAHADSAPESERIRSGRLARLGAAVSSLPDRRRQLIELELGGVTDVATLAHAMDTTPGAIKVLRHRTYRQLRRKLAA